MADGNSAPRDSKIDQAIKAAKEAKRKLKDLQDQLFNPEKKKPYTDPDRNKIVKQIEDESA